jgi:hypothetical protein
MTFSTHVTISVTVTSFKRSLVATHFEMSATDPFFTDVSYMNTRSNVYLTHEVPVQEMTRMNETLFSHRSFSPSEFKATWISGSRIRPVDETGTLNATYRGDRSKPSWYVCDNIYPQKLLL